MMRLPPFAYLRAGLGGRRRQAHGRPRARRHAGGGRHRSLPEHEAAAVRAEGARRAAGHPGARAASAAPRRRASTIGAGHDAHGHAPRTPRSPRHYPALATAAGLVSTPQLRNMGTLGGNVCVDTRCNYYNQSYQWRKAVDFCMKKDGEICLVAPGSPRCWAVSSSDTAPVLWSLGATVTARRARRRARGSRSPRSTRTTASTISAKRPDEVLTEIALPPADGLRSAYLKLRRRGSFDFPVLGRGGGARAWTATSCARRGSCWAPSPRCRARPPRRARCSPASASRAELIDEVAGVAARPSKPLDNTDLTHPYRKKMTRVFVARALRRLAGLPERLTTGARADA